MTWPGKNKGKPQTKVKLVVFDWNGVIIADSAASLDADNEILRVFGGKPVDMKTWRDTVIIPSIDFYVSHGADRKKMMDHPEKWAEVFHPTYEARVAKVRTRKGLRKTLEWLKKHGIECVILSNHTTSGIDAQLSRLGIKQHFNRVLANTEKDASLKKRTKLQGLQDYFKQKNTDTRRVLLIGDSPEEIHLARAVGAAAVAIRDGYYADWRLKEAKPDFLITRLDELKAVIK